MLFGRSVTFLHFLRHLELTPTCTLQFQFSNMKTALSASEYPNIQPQFGRKILFNNY